MIISKKTLLKSVTCLKSDSVSNIDLSYIKSATIDLVYEDFMKVFLKESRIDKTINRAFLARRSGKTLPQITRLLSGPGNWTLETLAALYSAIGYMPKIGSEKMTEMRSGNNYHVMSSSCNYFLSSEEVGQVKNHNLTNNKEGIRRVYG